MAEILADPALRQEIIDLQPTFMDRLKPAGREVVMEIVGARLKTFPQQAMTDAEWSYWWNDWYDACEDQPAAALEAGMKAWIKADETGFMPKPGQLLALAKKAAEPMWTAVNRAKRVASAPPAIAPNGYDRADPAAVKDMLADYTSKVSRGPPIRPVEMPATHGKADETGLTPEMRALRRGQADAG